MLRCIGKLTKYSRYAHKPSPYAQPRNVLVRLLIFELVWYLATEVKKFALSINYIHEAYRNYFRSYQEVPIKNEPHMMNCVNSFIDLV